MKVFLIIPVHNRLPHTIKCLSSINNQTFKNFEVIIVDGGSLDGTNRYIRMKYPQAKIIEGDESWWWTRSVYEGVKEVLKTSTKRDFVLTMNNDCYFKGDYVSNLVKTSLDNKRAIVGSLILDAENHNYVIDAGVKVNWKHGLIYGIADKISNNIKFYTNRKIIRKVDTLPGKGTLIPVKVFGKTGNFNYKRLPHYLGDYEFFYRARKNGFKLIVSSNARLYNFVKITGSAHLKKHTAGYREVLSLLFGRKSKLNIVDHAVFLLLCCPKKHLLKNFKNVGSKLFNYSLMVFPLYYIKEVINVVRLLSHNIPIYWRQNPTISKIKVHFKKFTQGF